MPKLLRLLTIFFVTFSTKITLCDFVETFDGSGAFRSQIHEVDGLDNPGWRIAGDGVLQNGGYDSGVNIGVPVQLDNLVRDEVVAGSFIERIEFKNVELSIPEGLGSASLLLSHHFDDNSKAVINLFENNQNPNDWGLVFFSGAIGPDHSSSLFSVPVGENIALELIFHASAKQIEIGYDADTTDSLPPQRFAPLPYSHSFSSNHLLDLIIESQDSTPMRASVDHWTLQSLIPGDFDFDRSLSNVDVDLLSNEVFNAAHDVRFDLNQDDTVNFSDLQAWVEQLRFTYFGDANLDGQFDSEDLLQVFKAGQYRDTVAQNSNWANGDWNGDLEFDDDDLLLAFQSGGYRMGQRLDAAVPVPEPRWNPIFVVLGIVLARFRRLGFNVG